MEVAIGIISYYFFNNTNSLTGGMMAAHVPGVGLRRLVNSRFKWGSDWYAFRGGYLYRAKDDWYLGETGASSREPIYLDQYMNHSLSDEEREKIIGNYNSYIRERRRRAYSNITDSEDLNEYESAVEDEDE